MQLKASLKKMKRVDRCLPVVVAKPVWGGRPQVQVAKGGSYEPGKASDQQLPTESTPMRQHQQMAGGGLPSEAVSNVGWPK